MESLLNDEVAKIVKDRIEKLTKDDSPQWGKMTVAQMLHHCKFPLQIALQKEHPPVKPNFLAKLLFKKAMYNDRPWSKNLPTVPSFRVSEEKNFEEEKDNLIHLIDEFLIKKDVTEWQPHPVFGKFTAQQWGQMQYKHLDHHLKQFNV
ncbi:DUF1569 domain-containing protein [Aquimarina brevivitae]|uniref:Uncharacterized protein DUF1569 n=1 Tax=Aquimarina brevivitae TaxID=323412 RepID=A0A4Q7PH92_9FLAO|nr:DUF1569 domain-containing protein [Aquimarina brevivitae]RZS99931.1 uncharacterized protein DUF1569 [Aquimarina brevivitae]